MTFTIWPLVFTDDSLRRNDGIVSYNSPTNGPANVHQDFQDVLHSVGMRELGFAGLVVLESRPIAEGVISVLNQPRQNSAYYTVLNP